MARVRFSDVVKRVNVFVDREQTDLLYYVGGEHIDSDTFMVRKKGLIKGATIGYKFHFGFQPGHILFMSRNPHLRKCSMVDFAGVCSDSTYVVETRDENVLLQKFLLIEMQSDRFWKWAEENKSGSVNYLINYCTLDSYEFDLPPIEEQRALDEKLWAANDLKEKYKHLLAATDEMLKAKFQEMFGECGGQSAEGGVREEPIGSHADVLTGYPFKSENFAQKGVRICGGLIIMPEGIDWSECKYWKDSEGLECYLLKKDDIVLALDRPWVGDGFKIALINDIDLPALLIQRTARIRVRDIEAQYLLHILKDECFRAHCKVSGSVVPHISHLDVKNFKIPIPPIDRQREFVSIANAAEASKAELKKSITSIDAVMRGLINW